MAPRFLPPATRETPVLNEAIAGSDLHAFSGQAESVLALPGILFAPELPRKPMGKVQKTVLCDPHAGIFDRWSRSLTRG